MYVGVCLVCMCFVSVGNLMLCPKKNKTNECHGESTTGDERNNLNFTQLDFDEPPAVTDSARGPPKRDFPFHYGTRFLSILAKMFVVCVWVCGFSKVCVCII